MISSWFNTPGRISALQAEAASWIGTPFFPNGNTKGMGVSCQKIVSEIYKAVGCCSVEVPDVSMAHARFSRDASIVADFMDGRSEVARVDSPEPGDMLGFRIYRVIHHCGLYLGDSRFIHASEAGTNYGYLSDATYSSRLAAIWRPIL